MLPLLLYALMVLLLFLPLPLFFSFAFVSTSLQIELNRAVSSGSCVFISAVIWHHWQSLTRLSHLPSSSRIPSPSSTTTNRHKSSAVARLLAGPFLMAVASPVIADRNGHQAPCAEVLVSDAPTRRSTEVGRRRRSWCKCCKHSRPSLCPLGLGKSVRRGKGGEPDGCHQILSARQCAPFCSRTFNAMT